MLLVGERPVSLSHEVRMDRTGFEPASRYLTGKRVTSYTTGYPKQSSSQGGTRTLMPWGTRFCAWRVCRSTTWLSGPKRGRDP